MLKIVYPICCGMDVHKSFVVACIASTNDHGVTTYKSKRFSTFTGDLHRCADWLAENNCKDVCMESTALSRILCKLRIIRSHMDSLELCKLNLESLILSTAEKYLPQLDLIMTVPGIQSFAAIGIISEIGVDMSVFPSSKHLCSWAGLTPQNNESAGKKKTPKSVEPEPTSNRCLFSALFAPSAPSSSLKSEIVTLHSKSAVDTKRPSLPLPECC